MFFSCNPVKLIGSLSFPSLCSPPFLSLSGSSSSFLFLDISEWTCSGWAGWEIVIFPGRLRLTTDPLEGSRYMKNMRKKGRGGGKGQPPDDGIYRGINKRGIYCQTAWINNPQGAQVAFSFLVWFLDRSRGETRVAVAPPTRHVAVYTPSVSNVIISFLYICGKSS